MTEPRLRLAGKADADSLSALATLVWLHTYALDGMRPALARYVATGLNAAAFRQVLSDPSRQLWVLERNGHLLAYAQLRWQAAAHNVPETRAELETLYVMPRFAGQGFGRRLLQAALAAAREHGEGGLWLTVYAGNAPALAFYQSMGLQDRGEAWFEMEGERHANRLLFLPALSSGNP
ncbi:GNAT family N-acetyltransferase [uncultured Aquitalea sp.]|uniref:GNAT family N-acetyltransferase n=1 Tax=uncultured Aquitalea sp. TaxID=540272 RepID=UPI0025DEFE0A|nr:GNAT family N-acetyltransferase [uncultured Aquitalea sp.]